MIGDGGRMPAVPDLPGAPVASAAVAAASGSRAPIGLLRRRAFLLGGANAFDYAMQFLLPVILARMLPVEEFGQYRLLWLVLMTVITVVPLAMPQSLYYFLPRADATERRLYVHQTLIYLAGAGLLGALLIGPWFFPYQPEELRWFADYGLLIPALLLLLVASSLLDLLPTIDERVGVQAGITVSLSLLRVLSLSAAAYLGADLRVLILILLAFALFKLLLLFRYVAKTLGLGRPWIARRTFVQQLRHAAPFGFSGALYGLRGQADQWVAATLFALQSFAAFSIAAVIAPLINLFRVSVNHAFLPSMSRLQAAGDLGAMLQLNSRANVMVAALVYPLLAFAFVFAEELVTLVYTATYIEAAPAMRVYIVSLVALVVELSSIMLLLKEGAFALRLNCVALAVSVALSWLAAQRYGLAGAAVGSALVIFIDRLATLWLIRRRTATPLHRLQDWSTLALLLVFSVLAALLAWAATGHYLPDHGALARLLAGGTILAATYAAMAVTHGVGRGWLTAALAREG